MPISNNLHYNNILVKILVSAVLISIAATCVQSVAGLRIVMAASIFLLLFTSLWKFPIAGVLASFMFLVLLGGVRRWLIPDFGWPAYDPLILIGAVISLLFFVPIFMSGRIPSNTLLSRCIKWLLVMMTFEVANPLQGGLIVGLSGVLYYISPLLWFYVGRFHGNAKIMLCLLKFSALAFTLTGLYGLKQVIFGLSSSEKEWVKVGGYQALHVSDEGMRVFSTFASQQEYATTLSVAISICCIFLIRKKFQYFFLLPVLVPALFLTGTRGPIVNVLLALSVQWAVMSKKRSAMLPRMGLALALGFGAMVWGLSNIDVNTLDTGQGDLLRHQQEGLLDPANSTAVGHFSILSGAIFDGIKQPLGYGLGATTIAASKLSGGRDGIGGAEADFGNLFLSLGPVGGILYLIVIFVIIKQTITLARETNSIVYLVLLGVLITCIAQWLNGALYCLCFIIWFSIGVMDKEFSLREKATDISNVNRLNNVSFCRSEGRSVRQRMLKNSINETG